jgi:hypothetical protein
MSKLSAQTATNILKLKPYKTTIVHKLQEHNSANRINFCNEILQFINDGETILT